MKHSDEAFGWRTKTKNSFGDFRLERRSNGSLKEIKEHERDVNQEREQAIALQRVLVDTSYY